MVMPSERELIKLAIEHGFGTWMDGAETEPLWYDANPLDLMRAVIELAQMKE